MDEIISEFLVESYENLDRLDQDLLALERDPAAADLLASIFRTLHTIKGTCGFLGFGTLESVTHAGESLLSLLRDGRLSLTGEMATTLLALSDAIRSMLETIEATGEEGAADYADLVATLERLQAAPDVSAPADEPVQPAAVAAQPAASAPAAEVDGADGQAAVPEAVLTPAGSGQVEDPAAHRSSLADSTIRVDVRLLDTLMTMVGGSCSRATRCCSTPVAVRTRG